ncbi:MAG: hypothetical protein EOM64_00485 [Erysipelotrichia bacterium]|nr:hypothetical protein [Erysipelotrichia bacterium]
MTFNVSSDLNELASTVYCLDAADNEEICSTAPDIDGTVSALLPEGEYGIAFQYYADNSSIVCCYQEDTWAVGTVYDPIRITAGETTSINDLN